MFSAEEMKQQLVKAEALLYDYDKQLKDLYVKQDAAFTAKGYATTENARIDAQQLIASLEPRITTMAAKNTQMQSLVTELTRNLSGPTASGAQKATELMTQLFCNKFIYDGRSTTSSKREKFKPFLARDYLLLNQRQYKLATTLLCQVIGLELPRQLVIASHIFKHEWARDAPILLGFDTIDTPRNGLLLFAPIEKAFDRSRICFLMSDDDATTFQLKILDPSIRSVALYDDCLHLINDNDCKTHNTSSAEVQQQLQKLLTLNGRKMTFGDLEGMPLLCKGALRPYKRCLNFQASRARSFAVDCQWIGNDVQFKYSWSQDFDIAAMNEFLDQLQSNDKDDDTVEQLMQLSLTSVTVDNISPEDAHDSYDDDNE